ncbi:hypothetical protein [Flavivirga algicola]|uniref:DinB family protein n=1 Tax=Flavivirga algicola TaxID=2729136 RepID=A0ABX1RTE6_9FLAO|nr:hypothetical protein [Flavivirga algicola]NMH85983.1 hypothetical protein [Flavivirga algicola]
METDTSITRLLEQYRFHDTLYKNVLESIKPKHTHIRLNGLTNHVSWIAGNLAATRFNLGNNIGIELKQGFPEFFKDHKSIIPNVQYPSLEAIIKDWDRITPVLEKRLEEMTPEQLSAPSPLFIPKSIKQNNILGTLIFLIDRESYAIGQIALIRKAFGYEAMKYE